MDTFSIRQPYSYKKENTKRNRKKKRRNIFWSFRFFFLNWGSVCLSVSFPALQSRSPVATIAVVIEETSTDIFHCSMSVMVDVVPCLPPKVLFHPLEWLWDGTRDTCTSAKDNCLWSEASCCSEASFWPPKENDHCVTMVTNRCRSKLISQWFQKLWVGGFCSSWIHY